MLNDIFDGVSKKLYGSFGSTHKIYQNDVKQGLETPCFFLSALKPSFTPLLGERGTLRVPLDVQYFPVQDADNRTMYSTAETLMEILDMIFLSADTCVFGRSKSFEIADGVLHFFVTYQIVLTKAEIPAATMETVSITSTVET